MSSSPRSWDEYWKSLSPSDKTTHCGDRTRHIAHHHNLTLNEGGHKNVECGGTPPLAVPSTAVIAERPSWDETWIAVADVIGQRSLCSRAKIGAVIVSKDNSRTWVGYNNPARGFDHGDKPCVNWCPRAQRYSRYSPFYDDCPSLHAEANAIMKMDRELGCGGTIYTTGDVCAGCAKLIANSGLEQVVVRSDGAEHRSPSQVYTSLEKCGITVVTI